MQLVVLMLVNTFRVLSPSNCFAFLPPMISINFHPDTLEICFF